MAQRFHTALSRRDRIWPAAAVSGALHAALFAVAILRGSAPEIDLEQKPIVAKLVRIGEQRPKELLPRKEEPPPAPAPADPAPVPVPTATAPVAPAPAVTTKPAAPRPPAPAKPAAAPSRGTGRSLSSVLDRVRKETDEAQWGSPDGDPMGDASDGDEGDRYLALVTRALQDNYNVPPTIPERERLHLRAQIALYIEADGRITRFEFERRSGNDAFDNALERAIRQTRAPPPPPDKRIVYRTRGILVLFHI